MCDCRKRIEEKLTKFQTEKMPESKDVEAKLMGYALMIEGNALISKPCMPIEVRHTVTVKKTGLEKRKVEKSNMTFSFCPFCGESLKK